MPIILTILALILVFIVSIGSCNMYNSYYKIKLEKQIYCEIVEAYSWKCDGDMTVDKCLDIIEQGSDDYSGYQITDWAHRAYSCEETPPMPGPYINKSK